MTVVANTASNVDLALSFAGPVVYGPNKIINICEALPIHCLLSLGAHTGAVDEDTVDHRLLYLEYLQNSVVTG